MYTGVPLRYFLKKICMKYPLLEKNISDDLLRRFNEMAHIGNYKNRWDDLIKYRYLKASDHKKSNSI